MKLLQLNVTANWGSTGRIAEGIGLAAMNRGWESIIAYGRYMNISKSELIKVGSQKDVYLHYAKNKFLDEEGLGSKNATKKLIKRIGEIKPDIIHLHNIHDHWLNYYILFDYLSSIDIPIVWTFHDCWAFTGGCHYFELPHCNRWKMGCGCCPIRKFKTDKSHFQLKNRIRSISPVIHRLTLIPVSHWLEQYCKESFFKNTNIRMIHNGINLSIFSNRYNKRHKPLILGVANLWDYRKGLQDFILLRNKIPQDIAEIILVGLTKKQIASLPPGIQGVERTQDTHELIRLYNEATVLINPTYVDNFPTVNLEALACGTPVITYRTGGSPEAIDSKTGIVVEKGNVSGLADAFNRIVSNPSDFSINNCRMRAEQHFNQEIQFNKYIDLYDEILLQNKQ